MRRRNDRRVPVEAILIRRDRCWLDVLRLPRPRIVLHPAALLRLGVDNLVIVRIGHGVEAVAACHAEPVGIRWTEGIPGAARAAPRLVVLQTAVDIVEWLRVVDRYGIKLTGNNAFDVIPRAA